MSSFKKTFIKSILESKELPTLITTKLSKFSTSGNVKYFDEVSKIADEDDLSDIDSMDSTKTGSVFSEMSDDSSIYTDGSTIILPKEINVYTQENSIQRIKREIKELKNEFPNENIINNEERSNNAAGKNYKSNIFYPLEFFEIFPNLKKFEISNQSLSQDFIEKPTFFIKNLILKIYHESLLFTQNKFLLQNFKNGPDYQYKIMNLSQPKKIPPNSEDITCMILGLYHINNTDNKNKKIIDVYNLVTKLRQIQNTNCNFIFFGYKNGTIIQYVLINIIADPNSKNSLPADNFFLLREYSIERIIKEGQIDKHVLCMSLSEDGDFLLAGYASGHIIIWKTTNGKTLHSFNDIFDMPVVSCEFVSISENNKDFLFLVSDLIGKVRLIKYTKNTFIDDHSIIIVSNFNFPCLLMKKLKFNKNDGGEDFNIKEIIRKINCCPNICLIGSLEYIQLFMIDKNKLNINNLFLIQNPDLNILIPMAEEIKKDRKDFYSQTYLIDNLKKIEFPNASFGLGYVGDLIKNNDNKEPSIILAASWKNKITLYLFSKELSSILEIGWYINNSPIIKIGFIDTSLIYFVDKNYYIKIINCKLLNLSITSMNDNNNISKRTKNKFLIPLSDIINIETPIKTISKTFTETIDFYNPFIINNKNDIYLIQDNDSKKKSSSNNFTHIHLLSYKEFFDETMRDKKWETFLCKFIDILKTNTNALGLIPENHKLKENLLIEKEPHKFVKNNYFGYYLALNFEKQEEEEDINFRADYSFLSEGIEFAIEIGSLDYIYNEIKKLKKQEKFKKDLVFQLEPFILNNKFQTNPNLISQELINEIIEYYISSEKEKMINFEENEIKSEDEIKLPNDEDNEIIYEDQNKYKLFKLDLVLCHLNIEIVKKIDSIEDIIQKNKLFCSIIYYYSNALNNFTKPLQYLFDEFSILNETKVTNNIISNNYFKKGKHSRGYYKDNYYNLIRSLKSENFDLDDNLFITKEFLGHLFLFYIQLTLKGILFPNVGKIPLDQYTKIIPQFFLFLTKKKISLEMINFDSFSYFETLTLFILSEDEINKLNGEENFNRNNSINNINYKENNNKFYPLDIDHIEIEDLKSNINDYKDIKNIKDDNSNNDNNLKTNKDYFFELIYKIMNLCENQKNNILIKFDLYMFIIKISLKIEGISINILNKALTSILSFHKEIKNIKKTMDLKTLGSFFEKIDKFGTHYTLIKKKQIVIDEISLIIINVVKKYYISNNESPNYDTMKLLLNMCAGSHFIGVKIYLYELQKDYINCLDIFLKENTKMSKKVFFFINKTLNLLKQNKDEKNLQIFKNKIKKIISDLAGVSNSETFKIIQQWFNSIDIISNLKNLPKLQFKYLDKLKYIYKRKLKNDKSIGIGNETTKKEYSQILSIYIKLLLDFEKEKRVLKILKMEEEYINIKECLNICLNKSIDASLYLYKLIGDEKSALKLCHDKIKNDYDQIKKNTNNNDLCSKLFNEIKKLIEESIQICISNSERLSLYKTRKNIMNEKDNISQNKINNEEETIDMGEDYWLDLFGQIYNILSDTEKENLLIYSKIKNYLTQKIENLLISMSYYVDFGFILKNVSNDLEFSLLKKFLNKIFYTKSHLSNLYNSYIDLLSNKINKKMKLFEMSEEEGKIVRLIQKEENENNLEKEKIILDRFNKYNFNYKYSRSKEIANNLEKLKNTDIFNKDNNPKIFKKCELCSKMLNFTYDVENSDLVIFKCDHIYHLICLLEKYNNIKNNFNNDINIKDNYCPKCVNIDTELFSFINTNKEIIDKNEINDEDNNSIIESVSINIKKMNSSYIEARKKMQEEKNKKKNWKKLNLLDNNYFEQIDILDSTLDGL